MQNDASTAGYFRSLFDLSFDELITPKIFKLIYLAIIAFNALLYIGFVIAAFKADSGAGAAVMFIFGPIGALLSISLARMTLELAISLFKIAENTRQTAAAVRDQREAPSEPASSALGG